jgi:hypothetical protein
MTMRQKKKARHGRDVGPLGETILAAWCAQVGIVANRAEVDRTGWDYLLELPLLDIDSACPLDRAPEALQAFVQVKATDTPRCSRAIKLSNWQRMVATPLPAFVLALHFDGGAACARGYLVHIDAQYSEQILRRLRSIGGRTPAAELNKQELRVAWAEADRLPDLSGVGLKERIEHHIGPSLSAYVDNKKRLLRELGYADGGFVVNAQMNFGDANDAEDIERKLADFALGLTGPLSMLPGARLWDKRFGIRHPIPRTIAAGSLHPRPIGTGTVRLTCADTVTEFVSPVVVWSTGGVASFIHESKGRVRLHSEYADLFVNPSTPNRMDLTLNLSGLADERTLRWLMDFAQLLHVLGSARTGEPITVDFESPKGSLTGRLDLDNPLPPELLEMESTIRAAYRLSLEYALPRDLGVDMRELMKRSGAVIALDAVSRNEHPKLQLSFHALASLADAAICIPVVHSVFIGGTTIGAAVAYCGEIATRRLLSADPFEEEIEMRIERIDIVEKVTIRKPAKPSESVRTLLDRVAARYGAEYQLIRCRESPTSSAAPP